MVTRQFFFIAAVSQIMSHRHRQFTYINNNNNNEHICNIETNRIIWSPNCSHQRKTRIAIAKEK